MSTETQSSNTATAQDAPHNDAAHAAETGHAAHAGQAHEEVEAAAAAATAGTLDLLQADLERFRDLALRSQADFENYRKRSIREREDAVKYANFSLVEKVVPVLDSFELGLQAAKSNEAAASIVSGMEMVRRQLEDVLHQFGVEAVDATGTPFDPNLHEAVAQEPSEEVPEGSVVRQLRKGYRLRDRLVRAALVVVSGGPAN
jgi:molecular chaperone GrpE